MNINSTQSATSNNFYPNPTNKQTLKIIKGVTEKDGNAAAEIGNGLSLPPVSKIHENNSFKRA